MTIENPIDPTTGRGTYNLVTLCEKLRQLDTDIKQALIDTSLTRAYADTLTALITETGVRDIPVEIAELTAGFDELREQLAIAQASIDGLTRHTHTFEQRHCITTTRPNTRHTGSVSPSRADQ